MTTYFEAGLAVREFGTRLLSVHDLLEWAKSKRLHLRTTPPIDGYEFVHIETLLCAIERHASNLTHDQALSIVANDPPLRARMVTGMGIEQEEFDHYLTESPAWLVQADAHLQWRKTFDAAIKASELMLLEFGSKLPIESAPAQTATPAPVVAVGASDCEKPATPNWKMQIQAEATAHCLRLREAGTSPTKYSILDSMAKWCRDNKVMTDGRIFPSANYLRTHVLGGKHWELPN